jgi:ATP-binding cassette subfamily B protein
LVRVRDEDWVLQDVSLHVAPGEKVALVGATGSGKTTIASLLMRFYDPQRGVVRVDGRDVQTFDIRALAGAWASCCRTTSCSPERSRAT